jgi:hypothetical protein
MVGGDADALEKVAPAFQATWENDHTYRGPGLGRLLRPATRLWWRRRCWRWANS